ncbi:Gfo/Idh/MocA family oxidoreductase [Rhizobium leguminosarum]|uniref:Gfo/Idh/MocA family protein n=1 Tax=Rhizobium leguminosarum TaxID=384 RepID=UPI0014411F49|nr:Gfo/Idh/MocA family oxidoreductase [Rhizobium leguminosarum]MBY5838780.1 Gfo/Idh/MocA family oxidoreductase [Rhizobium leguminosarum]NKM76910.1 gfo/Idh/MocA family oxidoreductase [Rhizobium leguminosarum bv. viciae]QSZ07781.1 Gfo/Idh/MocA family oxidoreductase [Rhizobium leguminosarum]
MSEKLRLGVIGAGLKAAEYAESWVKMPELEFAALADTTAASRQRLIDVCLAAGAPKPKGFEDYRQMLAECRGELDIVYVSTPHAFHAEQATAVAEAGLDLFLEKPMVTTVTEAETLIAAQKKSGVTIVTAFQGGLSPLVLDTRRRALAGEFGELIAISGMIWESWSSNYDGHWKQQPDISGGGFMFDTGAHMMNTVCLLANSDFDSVSAYMNNHGRQVDIATAVSARLKNGALATLTAAGEGPPGCASCITFFYSKAIVRIDAWGGWREISVGRTAEPREEAEILGNPMKNFLAIREGKMENSGSVEMGLRFARLWDAIKESAAADGASVRIVAQ